MRLWFRCLFLLCLAIIGTSALRATEQITLRSGFTIQCEHRAPIDSLHTRLFLDSSAASFVDVASADIVQSESVLSTPAVPAKAIDGSAPRTHSPAPASLNDLIRRAGERRSLNVDLLRAVIRAESAGKTLAVSRTGAQGLMQLMPTTARSLGVQNSFAPEENLRGGTDYLDQLLRRYHEDLTLALAAYNAGPEAVDRYHGVPPFRETRLYVARIIHEFNRQTLLAQRIAGAAAGR